MHVTLTADNQVVTARARATMSGPNVKGEATFTEYDVNGWKYVHIRLELKGEPTVLTSGKHAVHIHEKGDCECAGFTCARGDFDPMPSGASHTHGNDGHYHRDL